MFFRWVQEKIKQKFFSKIYRPNVNIDLRKKCNSDQWLNNDKCQCEWKKRHVCGKDYVWNPPTCRCKNGNYLQRITDDSAITCDEIIYTEGKSNNEETKIFATNFNEDKLISL